MKIQIQRRAEIALRSLQKPERKQIERALHELFVSERADLKLNPKFSLLAAGLSGKKIAAYKAGLKYRLVLSFQDDICILEDIVDHDRLNRLVKHEGQA